MMPLMSVREVTATTVTLVMIEVSGTLIMSYTTGLWR